MKALIIGGTGNLSLPLVRELQKQNWELCLLNRGHQKAPEGCEVLQADIADFEAVNKLLKGRHFDAVAQFIAYTPEEVDRDIRFFRDKTDQYLFVSSASAYQKPIKGVYITESTPLHNPYWAYSRQKAACERLLDYAYREEFFPVTIVRPSHTFSDHHLPIAIHGQKGPWQILERVRAQKPVLIPGDGTSLWTLTWAEDFARGFAGLMGNPHAIGEAVHITSDEALTWNEVHRIIAQILGKPFIPCHVPSDLLAMSREYDFSGALLGDKSNCALFDNSKIKKLVPGFVCTTRFDQGARQSIENFLNTPKLQLPDPKFDAFCDQVVSIMGNAEKALSGL